MNEPIIKCPVCGQEYLPSEIYMPDAFLGKPTEVIKTTAGKIDFYFGQKMDPNEEYICDNCATRLRIHANISFDVTAEIPEAEEHITKFNKINKAKLEEQLF